MATFRNTETGNIVSLPERFAERIRSQPHLVELDEQYNDLPSEPSPIAESDPALKGLRLADLRAIAEEKGLPTYGSKAQLIARITGAPVEEPGESDE